MIRATFDDAQMHPHDLIEAALRGEEVVITSASAHDKRIVRLVADPSRAPRLPREFGSAKGLLTVSDAFNDPLDEFAPY